ncbi:helix-turn-helix domain-containing protein, partial [Candidatus Giovannonibacteria bacterium]|nr:helix-turn-helix domain-containing protein [Candidatus Giovannonibacteria bacterium]
MNNFQENFTENGGREILLDGKSFLSLKRAGELSGYHSDYLGRLARGGKLKSRRVGIQWFIEKESLFDFLKRASNRTPEKPKEEIAVVNVDIKIPSQPAPFEIKKVEPSIFIKNLELKLAAEREAVWALKSPQARRVVFESRGKAGSPDEGRIDPWEKLLLGERPRIPVQAAKPKINFFSRHLLVPALAALLIFSFGLFGDSLALAGKSFAKNSGRALDSLAANSKL